MSRLGVGFNACCSFCHEICDIGSVAGCNDDGLAMSGRLEGDESEIDCGSDDGQTMGRVLMVMQMLIQRRNTLLFPALWRRKSDE